MPILQGSYGYRKEKGANQSNNLDKIGYGGVD
jgi:hypothetical protein